MSKADQELLKEIYMIIGQLKSDIANLPYTLHEAGVEINKLKERVSKLEDTQLAQQIESLKD